MAVSQRRRFVVVGGGISGLAAAYELQLLAAADGKPVDISIVESGDRVGGVLQTTTIGDFIVEKSADMFTIDPNAAIELCHELGIENELLTAKPTTNRAYVATADGMEPIPQGFSLMYPGDIDAVLASKILSDLGKARFLQEEFVPASDQSDDESLESFAVRRFGQEVFERLIQPLASGIYTADPKKLSMRSTMDRFLKLEREHGSLISASKRTAANQPIGAGPTSTSGARYGLFRAPKKGIGDLVHRLVDRLASSGVSICLNHSVSSVRQHSGRSAFTVETSTADSKATNSLECDGLILATPADVSASLMRGISGSSSNLALPQLESIQTASSAIVILSVEKSQLGRPDFGGYGIIVPASLGRKAIAVSFASNKFDGRAPASHPLIRVFIGGALQSELVDLSDAQLVQIATNELDRLVGIEQAPTLSKVYRWRNCMPQYSLGHLDRVADIESSISNIPGLELAGKSYRGVGIPACISSGREAAKRLFESA